MPDSGSAFVLASSLRERSDRELVALLRDRAVRDAGINDFFDLAEKLLEPSSVQSILARLDRRALLALAVVCELGSSGSPVTHEAVLARIVEIDDPHEMAFPSTIDHRLARLSQRALLVAIEGSYIALDSVCEVLAAWPSRGLPSLADLGASIPDDFGKAGLVPVDRIDPLAAERAFATLMAIDDLLVELQREGIRELARGGWGAPDLKRLAGITGRSIEEVPLLILILDRADLLTDESGRWRPTEDAVAWSREPLAQRWARLATAWLSLLSDDMRLVLADRQHAIWGEHFESYIAWMYPASDADFHGRLEQQIAMGELLGILADGAPSSAGSALVSEGGASASTAMSKLLPPEVDSVYVQHDLSIVSPGPLVPTIDARIREIAVVESRALATTFRISLESITRALATGHTEESITEFLTEISLTGIPQPLAYLINETATRFGMLRVGAVTDRPDGRRVSFVRTADPELMETVLVDRRLTPLGLTRESDEVAITRFERDVLYFALIDARYPAAAIDREGAIVVPSRHHLGREPDSAPRKPARDSASTVVARLRESATGSRDVSSQAWLERQLEVAVRSKLSITVTVAMPDGSEQRFVLEPTGLANGRLRARDRKAEIERTLPVSRITKVEGDVEP